MRAGLPLVVGVALALAAASTGTAIPSLRALSHGSGVVAGGFVALHVLGGLLASLLLGRRLRAGSVPIRGMALPALAASAMAHAAMFVTDRVGILLVLRTADGFAHVTAITVLMIAAAGEAAPQRPRRMTLLGMTLVLGLASGLGLGGAVASAAPRDAFALAAALAALAALVAFVAVPERVARAEADGASPLLRTRSMFAPALLVVGERFAFGVMSVSLPMAAHDPASVRRTAAALGSFMLVSVLSMPAARRLAVLLGVRRLLAPALVALVVALVLTPLALEVLSFGIAWALVGGFGGACLYTSSLLLVAAHDDPAVRTRAMGFFHAIGGSGHAFGSLAAGAALAWFPGASTPALLVALVGAAAVLASGLTGLRATRRIPIRSAGRSHDDQRTLVRTPP